MPARHRRTQVDLRVARSNDGRSDVHVTDVSLPSRAPGQTRESPAGSDGRENGVNGHRANVSSKVEKVMLEMFDVSGELEKLLGPPHLDTMPIRLPVDTPRFWFGRSRREDGPSSFRNGKLLRHFGGLEGFRSNGRGKLAAAGIERNDRVGIAVPRGLLTIRLLPRGVGGGHGGSAESRVQGKEEFAFIRRHGGAGPRASTRRCRTKRAGRR